MALIVTKKSEAPFSEFDLQCNRLEDSPSELVSESRRYYDGKYFKAVHSKIGPGHIQPWHRHSQTAELVVVLRGKIRFHEGKECYDLVEGDSALWLPDEINLHTMENATGEWSEYLTIKSPCHQTPISIMESDRITDGVK
ncbi:MAG: cupin domain-containing protein [Armatimonadetes bacterium]|nr:cupin domain-containing protein [Armatimonadota bacterium]